MASSPSCLSRAWLVVLLLVPVALLNYLDRQMLATMKTSMAADIPSIVTKADWGMVLACFKWTYALCNPFGGLVADRVNKKYLIIGSLVAWSAVTCWTGHVATYRELVIARAFMGISEAFYIPAAFAFISELHSGSTRSRAVGLHQSGIYLGGILGGFAGYVADAPACGWRWAFNAAGLLGVLYALPLVFLLPKPRTAPRHEGAPTHGTAAFNGGRGLFNNPNFWLLVAYFTLPAIAGWVVRDWMPEILKEQFSLGQGVAGVSAVLYVQTAALIGVLVGGALADRWMRSASRGRIFTSATGVALFLPALFTVGNAASLSMAIGGLVIFGFGWGLFDCNNMPILCQVAPTHLRATGYGIMNLISICCGGLGDWGFGVLRDRHMPLNVIFGAFAGVALLSVLIVLRIKPAQPEVAAGSV